MMPDLNYVIPEMVLLGMTLVLMLVDVFGIFKKQAHIAYLAQVFMVILVGVALWNLPVRGQAFSGQLIVDSLAASLKLLLPLFALGVFILTRGYACEGKLPVGEFHILAFFSLLGAMVLSSAHSLLTLYLGLELLSLPGYALVSIWRDSSLSTEAGMKYFTLGVISSGLLLYGFSLIYGASHSMLLSDISANLAVTDFGGPKLVVIWGMILSLVAIGFKLGAVPFHQWVPDVYEGAPLPVLAYLSTVPKLAGFVLLWRILQGALPSLQPSYDQILLIMAVLSLIVGNVVAIAQQNIRRMFAYSSMGHIGFVLLGLSLGTPGGASAAFFYLLVYSIMSLGAFGILLQLSRFHAEVHTIDQLKGLNDRDPVLAFMMMCILLAMMGIPPLVGFTAKLVILQQLVLNQDYDLAGTAIIMSVIGAFYYLRVIRVMYFDAPSNSEPLVMPFDSRSLLVFCGLSVLLLGLFPSFLIRLCESTFT